MLSNPPLQDAVIASLERDPRIPDPLTVAVSVQGYAAILQELIRDRAVPDDSIEVSVRDGWVSLTGYVAAEAQRVAAYDDVASLHGANGISNGTVLLGY